MLRRYLKLKTAAIVGIAGLVILAGLLVGAVRVVDLAVPRYRDEVAARVSQRINQPVHIGALDLSWDWHGPVLHLENAALLDAADGQSIIHADQLALHFGFWRLLRGDLNPQGLSLTGAHIAAYRDAQGQLRLRGLPTSDTQLDWQALAKKLDAFKFIRITGGQIDWSPDPDQTLEIRNVDAALRNRGPRHRVQATLQLPAQLGEQVSLSAFVLGRPEHLQQLRAHSYFSGQRLELGALIKAAGVDFEPPATGRNNLEIWSDWRDGSFTGARASLTGQASTATDNRLLQPGAGMDFSIMPAQPGYRITLDALRGDDRYLAHTGGEIVVQPGRKYARAELQDIPASLLGTGLALVDKESAWQTSGNLQRLNIVYSDGGLSGSIGFQGVNANNPSRGLQVRNVSGEIELARDRGSLGLRTADGRFAWAGLINGELPLDTLQGEIDWQRAQHGWQIHANDLRWLGAGAVVTAGGQIEVPNAGSPQVDVTAQVQAQDLPRILAYLPQDPDLPNPRLRDWLATAVYAGRMPSAEVRLSGPLENFPFAHGDGQFKVHAMVDQADLEYKPGWPAISDGRGEFTLEGDTLSVQAQSGKILGVDVGPASGRIENVREPILKLDGKVSHAEAASLLNFLPNSPLKDKFGRLAEVIQLTGYADLGLNLSVPLKHELGEVDAEGHITLQKVGLMHHALPDPIRDIRGQIDFNLKGLRAQDLHGSLLGLPLVADLKPADGGALVINANTRLQLPRDAPALQQFVPSAVLDQVHGEGTWHASLQVEPTGKASDLVLTSGLEGFSMGFPAPLGKAELATLPIRVEVAADRERVHVDLAERLGMLINFQAGHVYSMDMDFGHTGNAAPAGPGLWLGGNVAQLDVLRWQQFVQTLGQKKNPRDQSAAGLALRGASLDVQKTLLSGQYLEPVHFNLDRLADASGWQAEVSGPGAQGQLRWLSAPSSPIGARPLVNAHFERMELTPDPEQANASEPEAGDDQPDKPPFDPAQLPVTDLTIDSLTLNGHDFGHFTLQASAVAGGINLDKLRMSDGRLSANANGNWLRRGNLTQAHLQADLQGKGLDSIFKTLGYTPSVRADKTDIHANLNIAPNIDGLDPGALNGQLKLKFDDGALLTVDPGAGRVLGLFNFYALPRRLLLDFRDVVDEGLAFDKIRGDFNIKDGIARSDNLKIKTPSSSIRIKGQVDLGQRSYDQRVTIVPKLSSGVAVAGTVLGGPAVGAVLLIAQKLLEKPIRKLSSITYHLTGNWQDPEIEAVSADEMAPDQQTETPANEAPEPTP